MRIVVELLCIAIVVVWTIVGVRQIEKDGWATTALLSLIALGGLIWLTR